MGAMDEEKIGNYRIEKRLGEGGVGEVFRAVDPGLNRVVALKRLRPELARRPQIVERFRREARTLAQLNHPNIATLYSFEQVGDSLLMVMEYVEGETLSELLQRERAMSPGQATQLLVQALDGIGHAHGLGIVHRDIKGSNLMVRSDGVLKVMDFGIASVVGCEQMTQHGQLVGSPGARCSLNSFLIPTYVRPKRGPLRLRSTNRGRLSDVCCAAAGPARIVIAAAIEKMRLDCMTSSFTG